MMPLDENFDSDPWPRPTDKLFTQSHNFQHNASLNLGGKSWGSYSLGYKQAADVLAQRFLHDYQGMDVVAYPILFLYRHYVELQLKRIVVSGRSLLIQRHEFEEDHDLLKQWKQCSEILQKLSSDGFWPTDSPQLMGTMQALIKEFHTYDPDGFRFRYSRTKRKKGGLPSLPAGLNFIDIRNLYEVMQRLSSFLDAQIDGIDYYLHNQS